MKRISKTRSKLFVGIGRSGIGRSVAWLFVLSLLLLAGSCTQADVVENGIPPQTLKEVDAEFNLSVLANQTPVTRSITFTPDGTTESDTLTVGAKDATQTKADAALSDKQEEKIAELWVGQYDATTGTLLYNQFLSSITGTRVNLKLKRSEDKISKSHVYFVTNAGNLGEITKEADLLTHTLNYASTAEGLPENNLCPMMGTWKDVVTGDDMKDITVELTRLVAKITFAYTISNTADFVFTPTSVVLKNAPNVSQVEAPKTQLTTGDMYRDYTGTVNNTGTTLYWYLPENMAGTASGSNAVASEREKIGAGVTHATCIELTGNAKQGGVTYSNVTFRFFPGTNENNYDIERNTHHKMEVNLIGIDISDKRITVDKIPPIGDPAEMAAEKGSTAEVQITARPGQQWNFQMPSWLSAQLNGTTEILPDATISKDGPAKLVFTAETVNPNSVPRTFTFSVDPAGTGTAEEITITQAGSEFSATGGAETIDGKGGETTGSVTATEGLEWTIDPKTSNGITVDPQNGTGTKELTFTGAANTTGAVRTGKFTISVTGASPARKTTITAKQSLLVNSKVTINSSVVNSYKGMTQDYVTYPPFNYDEGKTSETMGSDRNGSSINCSLNQAYSIDVEVSAGASSVEYSDAVEYCAGKREGWRVPTAIEAWAMYVNRAALVANGCEALKIGEYWCSSVGDNDPNVRCRLVVDQARIGWASTNSKLNVRCVRDN